MHVVRRSVVAVAVGALLVALAAGSAFSARSAPQTITVPMVADETGIFAPTAGWQGADAYFKWLNAHGGVHGTKVNFKLYDAQSNPQTALQQTQRILGSNPLVFVSGSPMLYTALPTLAKSGVPSIGEGFAPQWGQGIKTFFSVAGDLTTHLSDTWLRVLRSQGSNNLALLTSPIEKADIELMEQDALALGQKVALKDESLPGVLQSADALRIAQRINASGADGVLIFGLQGGIQVDIDLHQLGWKGKVLQTSEIGQNVIKQYGAKANGDIWAGYGATPYATKAPGVREYLRDMKAAGYASLMLNSPYATWRFAQAKMLTEKALMPCYPNITKACIISHLSKLKNYTAGGLSPRISFPAFQNGAPTCLSVAKVINGKWVSLTNGTFPFICGGPSKSTPTG
jgi:branched-chain amino acid transport system substrate-binding protein